MRAAAPSVAAFDPGHDVVSPCSKDALHPIAHHAGRDLWHWQGMALANTLIRPFASGTWPCPCAVTIGCETNYTERGDWGRIKLVPTQKHSSEYYDVLRGVSAYLVFVGHIHQVLFERLTGAEHPSVLFFEMVSRYAVLIFFLLSGYLITQSIRINIARNSRFNMTDYLVARVARIYPPFIGALLICAAVWGVIVLLDLPGRISYGIPTDFYRARAAYEFDWSEIVGALFMYRGMSVVDGPLWTLYIEFQMYIAALGIAVWFGSNRLRWVWCGLAFLALSLAMQQPLCVAVWLMGAGANLSPIGKLAAKRILVVLLPLIFALAVFEPRWLMYGRRGELAQVAACLLLCCVIFFNPPKWRYPKWLISSAYFSYSLYVIHWPLLLLTLSLTQAWMGASIWRTFAVAAGSMLPITVFTMLFAAVLERQEFFRSLLRRLIRHPMSLVTPAPARPQPLSLD
jgi:peptidoglycan/LPS O-acetylase OafA/YrhL